LPSDIRLKKAVERIRKKAAEKKSRKRNKFMASDLGNPAIIREMIKTKLQRIKKA